MAKAIIFYGTNSGNSELVAEAVQEGLNESGIETKILRGETAKPELALEYDLVILICATWNVGKLQEYFEPFFYEFCKLDLAGKKMAVAGLGDSENYDIFCGAADVLTEGVKKVGGEQIVPTLRIDGPPHKFLEETKAWGIAVAKRFLGASTNNGTENSATYIGPFPEVGEQYRMIH